MGSTPASCGKGQSERARQNAVRTGYRTAHDHRARRPCKIRSDPGGAIEVNVSDLVVARTAIGDFQSMIRSKTARKLDEWLEAAKDSLVGSFAGGVEKDLDAVRNAIISPWSNGQTEGQITRLKLIKRQMYGRAKLDLLQARLIGAS